MDKQLTYQPLCRRSLSQREPATALLLFDIDGVIRDVGGSYRRALAETVLHFSQWRPEPAVIDSLKAEGHWNNDWDASMELLRRHGGCPLPSFDELVAVFSGLYFGGDPGGDPARWQGFIGDEPLLVERGLFNDLEAAGVTWGFVSGAEPPSARFVLEQRLGLCDPPLIAMGDAPDKPDPSGLLQLANTLLSRQGGGPLGAGGVPIAYLGDTVADVQTVGNARKLHPQQPWIALAVAPPHLHRPGAEAARGRYEQQLCDAGADAVLRSTSAVLEHMLERLNTD